MNRKDIMMMKQKAAGRWMWAALLGMVIMSSSCRDRKVLAEGSGSRASDTVEWVTDEEMPVLSWHSIELTATSLKNYQDFKNCGYTISLPTIWGNEDPLTTYNANLLQIALDVADRAGVKMIAGCHELYTDPENTVRRFMNHPALIGWYLGDEPSLADFPAIANLAKKIKAIDGQHFVYMNLRPADAKPSDMGTDSYTTYVNEFLRQVPVEVLSFDKYPCQLDKDGNLYVLDYWYDNLQFIADAAKSVGKDFWAFASGVKFESVQATPTIETLRLQMYTNLAYGAQGLQYFVYQNPTSPIYAAVRQMNKEIQNFAKVFLGAKVISVTQTGKTIPFNTVRFTRAPNPVRYFETGEAGAVVSVMEKGDRMFFVVVSRDINRVLPVTIEVDESVQEVTKTGTLVKVHGRVTRSVTPGDMLVYTWKK